MQIESLKIHENYDPNTIDYDICVLTVSFKKGFMEGSKSIYIWAFLEPLVIVLISQM